MPCSGKLNSNSFLIRFPLLDMVELLSEMCVKLPQSKGMLHDGTQYKWSFMEEDKKGKTGKLGKYRYK